MGLFLALKHGEGGISLLGLRNKVSQTRWPKKLKFTVTGFWRLEVQRSGCGEGWFLLRAHLNYTYDDPISN